MKFKPSKWDEATLGAMSSETIRQLYQPEFHYRVSWNRYPAKTEFTGWSRAGRIYLIRGSCNISIEENSWHLSSGEFIELPEGEYLFSVGDEIELVSVWEIPEAYRQNLNQP